MAVVPFRFTLTASEPNGLLHACTNIPSSVPNAYPLLPCDARICVHSLHVVSDTPGTRISLAYWDGQAIPVWTTDATQTAGGGVVRECPLVLAGPAIIRLESTGTAVVSGDIEYTFVQTYDKSQLLRLPTASLITEDYTDWVLTEDNQTLE